MLAFELFPPSEDGAWRTRLQAGRRNGIHGQQIDVNQQSTAEVDQCRKVFFTVVDTVDKQVFQRDASVGLLPGTVARPSSIAREAGSSSEA